MKQRIKPLILFTSFVLLACSPLHAQNTDEELAAQYYANEEYAKAGDLYKKLFKQNESSVYYYDYYLQCLIKTDDFPEAERVLKRLVRKNPTNYYYKVDEVYVIDLQSETPQDKAYKAILDDLGKDPSVIEQAANAFLKRGLNTYAIKSYETGNRLNPSVMPYTDKLLALYQTERKHQELILLALEAMKTDRNMLETVQKYFSRLIENSEETEFMREKILLFQQKNPQIPEFTDLSIWMFLQNKQFTAALKQAIAADKREKGRGERLLYLAKECIDQKAYDVAAQCYQTIINQGDDHINYMRARNGLLDTRYIGIKENPSYKEEDLQSLVTDYQQFLNTYGYNWNTSEAMRRLAEVHLFYTHQTSKSISLLEKIIKMNGVHPHFAADCKLMLGDAYLVLGEIWDAQLIYAQVDKDYKEDWLGQEAKFRMARLSYFNGEFDWAKDQLEVLKTATSQLISNNAIELSLLIQDNTGLDSTNDAMMDYAKADLLFFRNKNEACLQLLTQLPYKYPGHSLEDEIAFLKAKVMEREKRYEDALSFYGSIFNNHSDDILADNALYRTAFIYENVYKDLAKALEFYEKIILEYDSSLFVIDSRKRYNYLKAQVKKESDKS
jgi:tetratricopeptide (TPR) repeat protein